MILTNPVDLKIEIELIVSFVFKKELPTPKLSGSKNLPRRFPNPGPNASSAVRKSPKQPWFWPQRVRSGLAVNLRHITRETLILTS